MTKIDKLCDMIRVLFRAGYTTEDITEFFSLDRERIESVVVE